MTRFAAKVTILLVMVLFSGQAGWAQLTPGEKPWENPNSGFSQVPGSVPTSDGQTVVETVINKSGGSKDNGATVANTGTGAQQGVVDDFLNKAADTIKAANGGSAWVWTWQKKWKIGPDGNPVEVTESWQEGNINGKGPGAPVTTDPTKSGSPGPTGATPSPTGPSSPTTPGPTPGTPGATSATKPPSGTSATIPATPPNPDGATPAGPAVPPQGFDPAPPDLPNAEVRLVIQNPTTLKETAYPRNVFPNLATPSLTPLVCKNPAVPEDTRVKITLEFEPTKVRQEDLTLTVRDSEGSSLVPADEIAVYRHIFRIPDLTPTYDAVVTYRHPLTGKTTDIIRVAIPVYPMSFQTRTVEHEQSRGDR